MPSQRGHPRVVHREQARQFEHAGVGQGLRLRRIPQRRRAKPAHVGGISGDRVAAEVLVRSAVEAQADVVESAVAEDWPVVAGKASGITAKQVEPQEFSIGQRRGVAAEEVVES
jgi:hypothetical protein